MDSTQEWTEERLIAKAEGIAAHWHKDVGECNVFDLSRDILRLLRQQKDEYEAQLATLRAQLAALDTLGAWEPLEPGAHEHSQGTAYIDHNYVPSFGWSTTLRALATGQQLPVRPFEFRLCRRTAAPQPAWIPLQTKIAFGFGHESIVCDANSIGGLPLPDGVQIMERTAAPQPALEQVKQQDSDWLAMLRAIAKLADRLEADKTEPDNAWCDADDATLMEQFDPWQTLREVEAALATLGAWEPLLDDYWGHFNVERNGRVVTICTDVEFETDKGYVVVPLPDNVFVCRRTAAPQPADGTRVCSECEGDGELEDNSHISPPVDGDWPMITCWKCNGTGIEPQPAPEAND